MDDHSKNNHDLKHNLTVYFDDIQADFYSLIYEHYPDVIFILDKEGQFIYVSDKAEEFIGYKPNELSGSFIKIIKEEYKEMAMKYFSLALQGEKHNFNCKVMHKEKYCVPLNISDIPLIINGEIKGVFGFASNLTELDQKKAELTRITDSLNLAQEIAKIGSWDYDVETNLVYCSNQLYKIIGVNNQNEFIPLYENLLEMIHPADQKRFDEQFQRAKKYGLKMDIKYRVFTTKKNYITVHVKAQAKKDENEKVKRIIGVLYDITDRIKTEQRLNESEQKFDTIAKNLDVGIWSVDMLKKEIIYVSPAIETISGYKPSDIQAGIVNWIDIIHHEDQQEYNQLQSKMQEGEIIHHYYRIFHANGTVKWIEDKTVPIFNTKGQLIRLEGIVQDISERKSYEEKIYYLAYHDYLTELPNRRMFEKQLEKLIDTYKEKSKRFALLYLDLDRFKFVNDTLGHEIGDQLLMKVSKRLTKIASQENVFRMGGDEFTIIQKDIDVYNLNEFGETIISEIEKPFHIQGYDIHISTSVGISIFPVDGDTIKTLLMNSDVALYKAKELGKNNYQLFTGSTDGAKYKFALETELRKAILNQEFVLHYQPRIDTVTGEVVGAESLIRWNHPVRGLVSPYEFIPQAEQTGLINNISDWVLKEVCRQINEWKEKGYKLVPISLNLSAKTLMRVNLVSKIREYLSKYNISPKLIEIEITEESLINNEECAYPTIQELRDLGIKFAIDDFGTGYSSIGYLKRFPVDIIKIDRTFINNFLENNEDSIIVQSIILLAKGFRLKIVAEGVETEMQWEALKALKCHYLQGYFFCKPLPADQFINFILSKK